MKKIILILCILVFILYKVEEKYNNELYFDKISIKINKNIKINYLYTNNINFKYGFLPNFKQNKVLLYDEKYSVYNLKYKKTNLLVSFFKMDNINFNNGNEVKYIKYKNNVNFTDYNTMDNLCIKEIEQCYGEIIYKSININFTYVNNIYKYIINFNDTTSIIVFNDAYKYNDFIIELFDNYDSINHKINNNVNDNSNILRKKDNIIKFYKEKILTNYNSK